MTTAPIRTALLAYGMSGKLFQAPFLAAHPGFELYAVAERTEQRMRHDYPGIRSYASVAELLAEPSIELVVVNTPSGTHFELASQALRAGKHVLLEKPVATSVAQLQELLALAKQVGRHLLAYHNRRWDTDFGAVRRVVESGQLGQLIEVHFRFDRYKPALNPKKFKEEPQPGSGLLYDLGPHLIDQAISLFGRPLSVHKTVGHYRANTQVDDYFSLQLRYPQGLNVWLTSGLLIADPVPAYVLHGTQGSYQKHRTDPQEAQLLSGMSPEAPEYGREKPGEEGRLTLAGPDGALSTTPDPATPGNYLGLFEAVYQAIRHDDPYPIQAEQLLWQNELLESPAAG
ncbi:Gfo/Idh/MocA family protein [Hymenobacter properus]|uniref:Gfo/Idh/MocA family oxidoreductase n=1 Tax=Hymenobacter properus TaxID=2791026 RepID=A0A931BJ12_9BACT|nr:Gfo/Idh/MocA family oxidoreductase [Hymenobacter properus]MBF9142406.1 Gfo/Idh/MocA family oxidoreductase [Hymenobacter properus]MBR7721213.1 Gfo/Idh/MocA family oxidoreductase [Microvirga sp. SRT04]